jgi:AraC family transcriptional regulator of arabinose operon
MRKAKEAYIVSDPLPDASWTKAAMKSRSDAMTPLYVMRQRARFDRRIATYHNHWELLAARAGRGRLVGAATVPLREHTVCVIPPGVSHTEESDGVLDVIWVGLRGTQTEKFDHEHVLAVVTRDVSDLIERMWIFAQTTPGAIGPELDAMAALIVARFLRLRTDETCPTTDRVEKAILLFHDRMAEPVSVAGIARELGCSPSCFTREFRRSTGQTPIAYLTGIRIRHAEQLLETTDMKVREIAALTGYCDEFYFSRTFARTMGVSPSSWRLNRTTWSARRKERIPTGRGARHARMSGAT